jgi:hypothetical protein
VHFPLEVRRTSLKSLNWISKLGIQVFLATYGGMAIGMLFQIAVAFIVWFLLHRTSIPIWYLNPSPLYPCSLLGSGTLALFGRASKREPLAVWAWVPCAVGAGAELYLWTTAHNASAHSAIDHFFGPCQPPHCTDQWIVTVPLYCSVTYSLGAVLKKQFSSATGG